MSATLHASLTYPSWVVPRLQSERRFWMGVVLSILIHAALMLAIKMRPPEVLPPGGGPLTVELNSPRAEPPPAASRATPEPRTPPKPTRPPELMTTPGTSPSAILLEPLPVPVRPAERSNEPPSMMDFVNARRDQRAALESAIANDNANARAREKGGRGGSADIAERLNLNPKRGDTGGVFEIINKGHRFASFSFNGWNPSRIKNWREVIEVDAGLGGDVDLAIVRRMIGLIREHYKGEFKWESRRLGQVITLSARLEDTVGLETFMMKEFFADERTADPRRAEQRADPRSARRPQ